MEVSLKAMNLVENLRSSSREVGETFSEDSNGFTLSTALLSARDIETEAMDALLGYIVQLESLAKINGVEP